mmetsp:Transcript_40008/g.49412  ORF Transcript_40008/g.49412 Transcript_40008/m.49412 type:complete len:231 (+) Transcript_40008:581-1273(+)
MSQNNNNSQTQQQHTNPLLWNRGAYIFGNHDQTSILNQQKSNTNNNSNNKDPNVSVTKRKRKPPLKPDNLVNSTGLPMIHENFKKIKFKGKGYEIQDLNLLIQKYQEWCFQFYPMNFKDLIQKIETFSSKFIVKDYIQNLRDKRDGISDDLGNNIENDLENDLENEIKDIENIIDNDILDNNPNSSNNNNNDDMDMDIEALMEMDAQQHNNNNNIDDMDFLDDIANEMYN